MTNGATAAHLRARGEQRKVLSRDPFVNDDATQDIWRPQ